MFISRLAVSALLAVGLTGCTTTTTAQVSDSSNQKEVVAVAQKDEREQLWQDNKGWLLSKLPEAELLASKILPALPEKSGGIYSCPDPSAAGCEKLLNLLRQKLSPLQVALIAEGSERFAVLDDGTAYVFRMTDWTFSGIADLDKDLYFSVPNAPLHRTDGWSFTFGADDGADSTTFWTVYRGKILGKDRPVALVGEYSLARSELDAAGVPKQRDLLTPPQRNERELAKEGLSWRRRTQMQALRMCSGKPEPGNGPRKQDGHGGKGKRNHTPVPATTAAGSSPTTTASMAEALQGNIHLNCNAGSGYVATEDGIVAEVYRFIRNKDGTDVVIAATAKKIPGGIMQYNYPVAPERVDSLKTDSGTEMMLHLETLKGRDKLNLNLRADSGVSTGSLVIAGEWYLNPSYRLRSKNLSNDEFATLFMRYYRECAAKTIQDTCKSIPDLFISLLNPLILEEYLLHISDHYVGDTKTGSQDERRMDD